MVANIPGFGLGFATMKKSKKYILFNVDVYGGGINVTSNI